MPAPHMIVTGDCRALLPRMAPECINCIVTSPPYWGLRDYGVAEQIGLEPHYVKYVAEMVAVFREVRRVLRADGTLWLNLGDSYAASRSYQVSDNKNPAVGPTRHMGRAKPPDGLKQKDLCGIPWRVAFALQADGWYLRQDIIWHKPNPMPESVMDRCTKAHEYLFLLSKSEKYYYDAESIKEPATNRSPDNKSHKGVAEYEQSDTEEHRTKANPMKIGAREYRNKRSVWTVGSAPFREAHFATFPPALIEPCILAGCPPGGVVLDPFAGAGTTGLVATRLGRRAIMMELNPAYVEMAERRLAQPTT